MDFEDEKFGGYSVTDFDYLVRECRFFDIVEPAELLTDGSRWIVEPGVRPYHNAVAVAEG